jgi:UDP-N-acetylmuramate--alanine ligase
LDIYKDLADIKKTFLELISRVVRGGTLVLNADNKYSASLKPRIAAIARRNKLKVCWYSTKSREARKLKDILRIPGEHNLSNATGALILARTGLRIPEEAALQAIGDYRGSWRRYEFKGKFQDKDVAYEIYDDYAHHPSEIKATLQSFREKFPDAALICVFQAHQAERLKRLFKEFKTSFRAADAVIFFPEYKVKGREEESSALTAEILADEVRRKNKKQTIVYVTEPGEFSKDTVTLAMKHAGGGRKKAIVVMMGAGDIINYTEKLTKK